MTIGTPVNTCVPKRLKATIVGDPGTRLTRSQEPPTIVVSDVGRVFSRILTGSHTTA